MTPTSTTSSTTLLKQFGLTTAAEELVPRLTQAGHHDALPVLSARSGPFRMESKVCPNRTVRTTLQY